MKLSIGLVCAMVAASAQAQEVRLNLPVKCDIGRSCFVQHYVDVDPGPGAKDHRCGTLTYDGHDGTDFRVPTLAAQTAGVDVVAAADGRVLRVRDGMPDLSTQVGGRKRIAGAECGNGAVVAHAEGFETQYCHMAQGSVAVRANDQIRVGQRIGRVGMSGLAEFPHLHFTVRQNGHVVDPFAFGGGAGSCGTGSSLWAHTARVALAYQAATVINAGFAPGPVSMDEIESGDLESPSPTEQASALVAFVRVIGLRAGDVQRLSLFDSTGALISESKAEPLDRNKAQWMMFTGLRRPASGWQRGSYRARYVIERGGNVALQHAFAVELRP